MKHLLRRCWRWVVAKWSRVNAIVVATVVIAVAAVGNWTTSGLQWNELRRASQQTDKSIAVSERQAEAAAKQADISQRVFIASQRAWVGPLNAKLSAEPKLAEPLEIIVAYQNTGREPAHNFTYDIDSFAATPEEDNAGDVSRRTSDFLNECRNKSQARPGQVVYPSAGFAGGYSLIYRPNEIEVDDAIIAGEKVVVMQGCFVYQTLQKLHRSYFCFFYKAGFTKIRSMNICTVGHHAD